MTGVEKDTRCDSRALVTEADWVLEINKDKTTEEQPRVIWEIHTW